MKQLSKLTIAVALLLVPTVVSGKECPHKLKYATAHVYNMVLQCFNHLNLNSLRMFNAPIVPHLGINQCVCITEKVRVKYKCVEDYMMLVQRGGAGEVLGEYSKQCILDGAMGEAARQAYLEGVAEDEKSDNKTESTPTPKSKKENEGKSKVPTGKKPTWKDLSSQG